MVRLGNEAVGARKATAAEASCSSTADLSRSVGNPCRTGHSKCNNKAESSQAQNLACPE